MIVYCHRSGEITFGPKCPRGTLPLLKHADERLLRDVVEGNARHCYDGMTMLVPGVPEADSDEGALDAVMRFRERLDNALARRLAAAKN